MQNKPKGVRREGAGAGVIARLLPLTWFVYIMWKLGYLKRDHNGCYRGDPESFYISRWIFNYIPIRDTTKKGTKFCGNWHWFRLIFWEIHLLIYEPKDTIIKGKLGFLKFTHELVKLVKP